MYVEMKYWILFIIITISMAQDEAYVDSMKVRNPRIAWKLALLPGIGQLYNGKYIKAFGTLGAEYLAWKKFNTFKDLNRIGMRNTYAWWIIGIYVWSILDSYVDAQLSTFPEKQLEPINTLDSLQIYEN